jgi:hypothetical protein
MDKKFWSLVGKKVIETIISVKVIVIFSYMILSGILVWYDKMTGTDFATSNGAIISIVFALREGFKISKIKSLNGNGSEKVKEEMMV